MSFKVLKTADIECQWKLRADWTRGSPYSSDYASWMLSADWSERSPHSCHSKRYPQDPKNKTNYQRPPTTYRLSFSSF